VSVFRPGDRNHADYRRPAYLDYYRNQLRELLKDYGPVFEVWFDGANGGDGYYGGARDSRNIDASTYYDWENTWSIVRALQPRAMIFRDAGPDVRWVATSVALRSRHRGTRSTAAGCTPGNLVTGASRRARRTAATGCRPRPTFRSVRAGSTTRPKTTGWPRSIVRVRACPALATVGVYLGATS